MIIIYFTLTLIIGFCLFFNRNKRLNYFLLTVFLVLQWTLTIFECYQIDVLEFGFFKADSLAIIFLLILSILSLTSAYHSIFDFKINTENPRERGIYYAAFVILIAALTGAYLSCNMVVIWIFIEITTLSASVLIYHRRNELALEAAWKYLFVCSIGLTISFVGILFLSIAVNQNGSSDLSFLSLASHAKELNSDLLKLSFLFIMVGYSTKMGLFPMHTVCIDAHTVAPPPISAFISTVLMNVGFLAILRIFAVMANTAIFGWIKLVLIVSGILSIFVATVYMLRVSHHKRMFAYSSLEHMGLVALGLASGGIGYYAVILHLIFHSFTKASLFYQINQSHSIFKTFKIKNTGNYFNTHLFGGIIMIMALLSITAMPPSGMFMSEFLIFRSLFDAGYVWVLLIALLLLTFILWVFAKNTFQLLFLKPEMPPAEQNVKFSLIESISQLTLLCSVFYLGLNPPVFFTQLIQNSIKYLPK